MTLTVLPAAGNQFGQVTIALVIHGDQGQPVRMVLIKRVIHPDIGADNRLDTCRLTGLVELDQTEQVGVIRQCQRRQPLLAGLLDQRLEPNQAVNQRIFTMNAEMNEGHR